MKRYSRYAREFADYAREFADIERRMHHLERRLDNVGTVASRSVSSGIASAAQATDRIGEALLGALGEVVDRFRGGARSVSGGASRFGQEAGKLSGDALRRVTTEVARRPLAMLAIAAGIGLLIGLAGRRH
jgi:ElaB/YqjD/DUF883 family membrane-anchored ribosome-binding protein